MTSNTIARALSGADIEHFIEDGFIRIDAAFSPEAAAEARAIMWRDLPCDRDDQATWTRPVVRLPGYGGGPFTEAAQSAVLHAAFDQLVGKERWVPRKGLGTFPVRFPNAGDPGDTAWHVDASFSDGGDASDFTSWRVNVRSRGRALLMLFLFSDVGEQDAPTRIRIGSHQDMARLLAPAGEAGVPFMNLDHVGAGRPEALATGPAGAVYLCHPFLVHAAQPHRGSEPRFMAQPPLELVEPLELERKDGAYSPVEIAIRRALQRTIA